MSKFNIGKISAKNVVIVNNGVINNGVVEINTKEQYDSAMKRIEEIFDAKPDTKEFEELKVLGEAISKYEDKHFNMD